MKELATTIDKLSTRGKGILAADESAGTIGKRFAAINIESTEETRRAYRDLLITTPSLSSYIAGIILFEETLQQNTLDGTPFPKKLNDLGILPGIKVDKGLIPLANAPDEQITQGLDGLNERLIEYKKLGATFAKWRAVYTISANTPSMLAMKANAEVLARYAAICQANGIVPIVEPEVLIDGDHSIERCYMVSEKVLHAVFNALYRHKVQLEYMVLKPSMVISGKRASTQASVQEVATKTLTVLRRTVPAAVPTINFLSGGQTPEEATAHLDAMNKLLPHLPWNLSFSYSRALQEYPLKIWHGDSKNITEAQKIFIERVKLNSLAAMGQYASSMESDVSFA